MVSTRPFLPLTHGEEGWRRFSRFLSRNESKDGRGFGFSTSSVCLDGFVIRLNRDFLKNAISTLRSTYKCRPNTARHWRRSIRDDRCVSRRNRLRVYGTGRHVNHRVVGDCRVVFAEHAWLSTRERAKRATDRRTFRINYGERNRVMVICFTLKCFFLCIYHHRDIYTGFPPYAARSKCCNVKYTHFRLVLFLIKNWDNCTY